MTTTTTHRFPAPTRRRGPHGAALRTAVVAVAQISGFFWLAIVPIAVGVVASNARTVGVSESIVTSLSNTPRWFALAMGIVLIAAYLRPHVASGRTRRLLLQASTVAVVVLALASAAVITAGMVVERTVYEANGWPLAIATGHVFTSTDQLGLAFVENALIMTVFGVTGLLIGISYRVLSPGRASFAIPLTASPALLALAAIELRATSDLGGRLGIEGLPPAVTLATFVVLAAAAYAAAARLIRGVQVQRDAGSSSSGG